MRKKLLTILLVSLLSGCSNSFIYNQLDWLIPWYVGDFLDLNGAQKQSFKQQLLPMLDWHRQEELQNYQSVLDSIASDLDKPVTTAIVDRWANEFFAAYDRLKKHGIPLIIGLAEQMSDLQLQYFMEDMFQDQLDLEELYLTRSETEFRQQTYGNFVEGISGFIGELEKPQLERLQRAASDIKRFDADWLAQRRAWLAQTEKLLERNPGWQKVAYEILDNREQFQSGQYKSTNQHNEQIIYAALAAVIEQRSRSQDKRLRDGLSEFRRDITKLLPENQQ